MKTKIFALIAVMLCIGMLLVSCGEEEAELGACTSHVDENKDKKCDTCATDYIAPCTALVDEDNDGKCDYCGHEGELPGEEIPVMVVNPIPSDADVNDYFDFSYKDGVVSITQVDALMGGVIKNNAEENGGRIVVLKYTNPISEEDRQSLGLTGEIDPNDPLERDYYNIYDLVQKKTVYSFATAPYNTVTPLTESYVFRLSDYYFSVMKTKTTYQDNNPFGEPTITYTYTYYTNAGDSITITNTTDNFNEELVGEVFYLTVNDRVFPIDINTEKRLTLAGQAEPYFGNIDTFVKRPAFDHVYNNMGYVFERNSDGDIVGVQVYDLKQWLDCVYSYTVPSYVDNEYTTMGVLNNSTILVQTMIHLMDNVKAYDVIESGEKYDIVYTVINPIDGSVKEIEFGYYISSISEATNSSLVADTTLSPNVAYIYPIVEDMIDYSDIMTVIVDNDLNILCELDEVLPAQYLADKTPVGGGLYVVTLNIGGDLVDAVIDELGKLKTYLPENCYRGDGFIIAGTKIYSYDMTEKFNLRSLEAEYTIEEKSRGFLILSKPNVGDSEKKDYYYYDPAELSQPDLIASESTSTSNKMFLGMLGSSLFVIRERLFADQTTGSEIYRYYVFNANNDNIKEFGEKPIFAGEYDQAILATDGTYHYVFSK